jgi:hypothetical protein
MATITEELLNDDRYVPECASGACRSLADSERMCGVPIYPRSPDSEPQVTIVTTSGLHVLFSASWDAEC